ncbi:MAG: hypothetical protein ACREUU_18820 [Gammaproteobacteria bacterium]
MSSFEQRFYLQDASLLRRLRRDVLLIRDCVQFLFVWVTRGGRIRRALRRAEASGSEVVLEELFGGPEP